MNVFISLFAWRKFFRQVDGIIFGIHRKCISLKARGTLRSHSIWRCSEFFSSARINRFVTQTAKMKAIISPTENGWDKYLDYMFYFFIYIASLYMGWTNVHPDFQNGSKNYFTSIPNDQAYFCHVLYTDFFFKITSFYASLCRKFYYFLFHFIFLW